MKINVYTAVFLRDEDDTYLCLKRAEWKKFAPNKYTGIGGTLESGEVEDIEGSLKREFEEETKIPFSLLENLRLRGTMFVANRDENDHVIYYFLADVKHSDITDLSCNEGELVWVKQEDFSSLDWIGTVQVSMQYIIDPEVKRFSALIDEKTGETSVLVTK